MTKEGEVDIMAMHVLKRAKVALESLDTEGLVSCYADHFLFEDVSSELQITEKAELKSYFERLFALPNVRFSDTIIYDCDAWAALEWTWSGTVQGSDVGYRIRGASIIELRNGKIARETIYFDPRPALP